MTDLIDTEGIARIVGLARSTVRDRLVHSPGFPAPALRLNARVQRWAKQDIEAWIERQRKRASR